MVPSHVEVNPSSGWTLQAILGSTLIAFAAIGLLPSAKAAQVNQLDQLLSRYREEVTQLAIPSFQLGYIDNLNNIRDAESRAAQRRIFEHLATSLAEIDRGSLHGEDNYRYQHLAYRIELNLRRLDLEDRFKAQVSGPVTTTAGIYHLPLGKEWYRYFLQTWLSTEKTPEWLTEFGKREVAKVQGQIKTVQEDTGYGNDSEAFYRHLNDPQFLLQSEAAIKAAYRQKEAIVKANLSKLFLYDQLPEFAIEPWPDADKDTPPGRVVLNPKPTFMFNFYQQRHNTQDMDFLYLHEVTPGHGYAYAYANRNDYDTGVQTSIYTYHGVSEGWGAYVEELGSELGLYQTPYDAMGKLKFDLVRSARVVLDVGINYYGWTNEQALAYWHENIQGQDDIAQREIDRVRRWPAQAISYKVGADKIMELRALAEERMGQAFDVRTFHHQILAYGGVPLSLVEQRVKAFIEAG